MFTNFSSNSTLYVFLGNKVHCTFFSENYLNGRYQEDTIEIHVSRFKNRAKKRNWLFIYIVYYCHIFFHFIVTIEGWTPSYGKLHGEDKE